ncbi:LacI family DNA-binding transcriptional regulator [Planobispora siamensis]|uniref:LacI family transcriptional regulator n=1 Tax=Planobispora siamensis TaxID=936338 RepID=A0A8J3SMA1_9ACTN|nr:LacI family DNA-binding transcriptional regulator [Planobispora siamensis]GIH96847.1 LacI family transcriptional regulator [Planobispora siamensis]
MTIYEVAERASVSIATVSRVLRGNVPVSPGTAARVRAAVAELRYRPSHLGRGLAERQHAANGIVFPDLSGPYYAEVVLGYESVAAELGRSVLILSSHGRPTARDMVMELAARVDGLVFCTRTVDDETVREVAATGTPVVLIARPPVADVDTITTENRDSAALLAEHLLGHGYRRVVFLGDADRSSDFAERFEGVRQIIPAIVPVACGFDENSGFRAAEAVRRQRPDAVICCNDEVALGLTSATAGSVPVTGWDDVMAARYAGLTTVRQPMRELGARAARLLDERITGARGEPHHDVLPTRLIVRSSCGPHPKEET